MPLARLDDAPSTDQPAGSRRAAARRSSFDDSFELAEYATVESVTQPYRQAWEAAVQVAADHDLDDLAMQNRRGPLSLRWIYLHMIRELARRARHGDIPRKQLLSADGGRTA